jgi:putative ABC transport system permease protein
MGALFQDIRYAGRTLARSPRFALVAVATLAVGIGATTAIFSLIDAVLLRPLPFQEPGRLVWITNTVAGEGGLAGMVRGSTLRDWRRLNHSFEDLAAYMAYFDRINPTLTGSGEAAPLESVPVTENFLAVLGVRPQLGRSFLDDEMHANGPHTLMLTDAFWRRRFHADPSIVGRSITVNNESKAVIGILPASFDFAAVFAPGSRPVDFVRPFVNRPAMDALGNCMAVVGRLKPGVTVREAQAEFDLLNNQLQASHPEQGRFGARVVPLREHVSGQFRRPFLVLGCAVGCVLLIACVNLSNLLLARAVGRRRDVATRMALGAGRWALVRQMLAESLLLAICGAVLGGLLAHLGTEAIVRSNAIRMPVLRSARIDLPALGFAGIVACLAGLGVGIMPAIQSSNPDIQNDLREGARGSGQGRRRVWARQGLVISEMVLACVLLIAAGLLIRSFVRLIEVDPGFRPQQAATWRVQSARHFPSDAEAIAFYETLVHRVGALSGVVSAGLTDTLPFGVSDRWSIRAKGDIYRKDEASAAHLRLIDPGYLTTMGIPLRAGRAFDSHDDAQGDKIAIVNENLARKLWPIQGAVGQILLADGSPGAEWRIVGVVGNVRHGALEDEAGPELYLPGAQAGGWNRGELVIRTSGPVEAIVPLVRATLRQLDPNMPSEEFRSLSHIVEQAASPKRLVAILVGTFSLFALLLASMGIYGVMAYSVAQRTHEIGVRMSLGATRAQVLSLVARQGMAVAAVGLAVGMLASISVARLMPSLLFGITPNDPLTYATVAMLLSVVSLAACLIPAARAAGLDPMVALRDE